MNAVRDESILRERVSGDTFREIGERHGISTMRAHTVYSRAARQHLDDLQRRLLDNAKSDTDELEVLLVPGHSGPDFDAAITYLSWVTSALAERGVELQIHPRPAMNGVAFGLEDVTRSSR
jgi:hypothetical protein